MHLDIPIVFVKNNAYTSLVSCKKFLTEKESAGIKIRMNSEPLMER